MALVCLSDTFTTLLALCWPPTASILGTKSSFFLYLAFGVLCCVNYPQDAMLPLYGPVRPDALAAAQHTIVVVLKYASGAADVIDLQAIPGYEGFMKNQQSLLLFEFTQVRNVELVT
jgi:hypothetical protein